MHFEAELISRQVYTRQPGGSPCFKIVIYTAAVQEAQPNRLYARQPGVNLKLLFTRQPFIAILYFMHGSRVYKPFGMRNSCRVDNTYILDARQPCI